MGQPFVERRVASAIRQPGQTDSPKGKQQRGLFGWVLFVGAAVLLFLFLQHQRPTPRARHAAAARPSPPIATVDAIAWAAVGLGVATYVGLFVFALTRRGRPVQVIRWHFDDTGIYTDQIGSEHYTPWEWVADVRTVPGGLVVDRGLLGARLFSNEAFNDEAERAAFVDAFERLGMRPATEVPHVGARGFEV